MSEHHHDHQCCCHKEQHEHKPESCNCKHGSCSCEHEHHHHYHHEDGCGCGHDHGKESALKDWLIPIIGLVLMIVVSLIPFGKQVFWLEVVLYAGIYLFVGHEVLLESAKHIAKGKLFDENFLMTVASLGAFLISDHAEAIAVMIFYCIGECCQNAAVRRSKKSVSDLMDIRPDYATVMQNGEAIKTDPQKVMVGETILIRPGERIPLDCVVIKGNTTVNTAALTGESLPAECSVGDNMISGCVNLTGTVSARVEKSFSQSTVSRVLSLMEESSAKKTRPERFITRFAKVYTPIVCGVALLTAIGGGLLSGAWMEWIHTALTFLVISCPCALVISVPLSYVGGIGNASRYGILCKGSLPLEQLTKLSDLVCDKTGTVTEGRFSVAQISPVEDIDAKTLLTLAASAEQNTTHPIGRSVMEKAKHEHLQPLKVESCEEYAGKGILANLDGEQLLCGNAALLMQHQIPFADEIKGQTVLYLAKGGRYLGYIALTDAIRPQAKQAFADLKHSGIRITMLTGDSEEAAQKVAAELDPDAYRAKLLPQDKVAAVEEILQKARGTVAFVGDGVNDAPVLARADVGIAMGEIGSDAALEAADVVIMQDDLTKLPLAVKLARQTKRIVYQNIIFALGVKLLVILLGLFGFANMWLAVFADVGVALLAIMNAIRPVLTHKKN